MKLHDLMSFITLIAGDEKPIKHNTAPCRHCQGQGTQHHAHGRRVRCKRCHGTGLANPAGKVNGR